MFTISKRYAFSASHVLVGLPEGHPCGRLHGHNYEVEVVVSSLSLDGRGFVVDYHEIDAILKPIIETLDHHHLNDVAVLRGDQPSAEIIARRLWEAIDRARPDFLHGDWNVDAVRVSETPKTVAEFCP